MADFDPTPLFVEGTEAVDLVPEMRPNAGDLVVTKTRYSAFVNTDLDSLLRGRGVDTVVVSGLMTNYCCDATARHAHDLDYRVLFVADATAGPDMPDLGFGEVSHAEMLRAVATSLAGGIAEVVHTSDVVQRLRAST
jgi:ureidoacrylate peracid hydrolase